MPDNEVRAGLHAAARARARADKDKARATAALARWLVIGRAGRVPIAHLADWAGVTRQTVYALIANAAPRQRG